MKISQSHWKKIVRFSVIQNDDIENSSGFSYSCSSLQWSPKTVTSNKTTVPAKPLTDEMNLSAWDTFDSEYQTWRVSFDDNVKVGLCQPNESFRVDSESIIQGTFLVVRSALLDPLLEHFGYALSFLLANNLAVLSPDIVCVDTGRHPFEVVKIVIKIKTPWALPTADNVNLVEKFNEELQILIENNRESTSSTGADILEKSVSQLSAEAQSATKETKHIRLFTQI
jgi:hypothetical protein